LTIDSTKNKFSKDAPNFVRKLLPYDLKVKWVDEGDTLESVIEDKQIVVYVPTYKDEVKQAVGILHNYCTKGFAQKAKIYMPTEARKASDLIVTQKLTQYAGPSVYDYFNREYMPELLKQDKSYYAVLEQLRKVDNDGLFLPILLNEIDKFANKIYPTEPSPESMNVVIHFMNFIYRIISRSPGERVPLTFCEDAIRIKIILAVSVFTYELDKPIEEAENALRQHGINTVYVLATGSKIEFAREIASQIYERNPLAVYEPIETNYKRYTRKFAGKDSICFEINVR